MINKHNATWTCALCKIYTNTLHEVFHGTAWRKKSIEYTLQVPICPDCHDYAHQTKGEKQYTDKQRLILEHKEKSETNKGAIQQYFCDVMGFPARLTLFRRLENRDVEYLNIIKGIGELSLKRLEV